MVKWVIGNTETKTMTTLNRLAEAEQTAWNHLKAAPSPETKKRWEDADNNLKTHRNRDVDHDAGFRSFVACLQGPRA